MLVDAQTLVPTFEINFCSLMSARIDYLDKIQNYGYWQNNNTIVGHQNTIPKINYG